MKKATVMRQLAHVTMIMMMMFLSASGVSAQTKSADEVRKITLQKQKVSLREILTEIEKQAGVTFSYESSLLKELPTISFKAEDETLKECLSRLFSTLPVTYKLTGNVVVLKRKPRQVTISGFVRDQTSSESLVGASVFNVANKQGTATNSFGFFSLTLPAGDIRIHTSYIGYKSQLYDLPELMKDTVLSLSLEPGTSLQEVVITATDYDKQPVRSTQMGAMEINQQTIRAIPTLFGETDIIKTLQLTPGVATGTEGLAGLYVRGGNVDENLFLIDGNPVYQINHVGGIFSAFNSEAIRNMEFFKAGFPARYGGRLSSVVDVNTKEGNMKEYHGSASLGLIAGNLSLEGPIIKDRTSFHIALRRTWLDVLTAPALAIVNKKQKKDGSKTRARYAFHDLNLKVNHRFNDRSRMFVSLYNGNDVLKGGSTEFPGADSKENYIDDVDASLRWGNLMATAGWTYVYNNQLFGKISGVYTRYRSNLKNTQNYEFGLPGEEDYTNRYNEISSQTSITDIGLRSSFDYQPAADHHIRFGADFLLHRFRPEYNQMKTANVSKEDTTKTGEVYTNDLLLGKEFSLFAEDDWALTPALSVNAGLRFSLFNIQHKTYTNFEPRLSMRWLLAENLSFKTSYARMAQYVHLLSNSYMNLPTDAWMPVTRKLKPLVSDQVSAGFYYNLNQTYNFSIEGYFKKMHNQLDFKDGYSFLPGTADWEDKTTSGTGRGYGAEFMVRKETGRTTGWVGYTLSWADRKFKEINNGERFPSRYDNRHKLNIVVMHKLSPKVELTGAWTYSSGNHLTLSLESFEGFLDENNNHSNHWNQSETIDHFTERNNFQMPAYHRLDLGINIYRPKKKGRMGIWNISIYNVYSRMNPFMVYKSDRYETSWETGSPVSKRIPVFKQVGIMPIIPSITYTYKF